MPTPNKCTIEARVEEKRASIDKSLPDLLSTLPNDAYLSSPSRNRCLWEQEMSFGDSTTVRKLDVVGDIPSIVPMSLNLVNRTDRIGDSFQQSERLRWEGYKSCKSEYLVL